MQFRLFCVPNPFEIFHYSNLKYDEGIYLDLVGDIAKAETALAAFLRSWQRRLMLFVIVLAELFAVMVRTVAFTPSCVVCRWPYPL